jgi:hypothetical protein
VIQAHLHARNEPLKTEITHIAKPEYAAPFYILTMRTQTTGAFSTYLDLNQLQQIADTLNAYLAQHTPNTTEEPTHAHAS